MLFLWHVSRVLEGGIKMQDRNSWRYRHRARIGGVSVWLPISAAPHLGWIVRVCIHNCVVQTSLPMLVLRPV
jgi:hypothetical protein